MKTETRKNEKEPNVESNHHAIISQVHQITSIQSRPKKFKNKLSRSKGRNEMDPKIMAPLRKGRFYINKGGFYINLYFLCLQFLIFLYLDIRSL